MNVEMKARLTYRAHGVGKYRTKCLFLDRKGSRCWVLPQKLIKVFFPNLVYGSDYAIREVTVEIKE